MEEAVEVIPLMGFDPEGEPELRRTAEGRLWLGFQFMPPSWAAEADRADLGPWADLDQQLARAVGVPVVWEDREWFRIERPGAGTVEALRRFLLDARRRRCPSE